eukprot:CAMPEP_0174838838 /NCGR_PEP_ID=MMETSP1114-20130205/7659_1 /TAXON_ID=312471 /ORGANISM="Neobodo designis, Strain CCAP 1951/1" /LENGTH=591 /DNA_ID=CAMNT_0016072949 /DNA_START=56 /DNA_END=1831 /DNA_ORIENTATION=+
MARIVRAHILLAALAVAATCAAAQSLDAIVASKEAALSRLADQARATHARRCSALTGCNSLNADCSVHACGNHFPGSRGFNCTRGFGEDPSMCGSSCGGLVRSLNASVLRFPTGVDTSDGDLQAFACSSKGMQATFEAELRSGAITAWEYVGHSSGSIRIYPGAAQARNGRSSCGDYDARLRPWYIAASSGPKDVVLVVDVSGSMGASDGTGGTRMSSTRNAVIAILRSLTQNDRVSVVLFNHDARELRSQTRLQRATPATVDAYVAAMSTVYADGGTSFLTGFRRAFTLLEASQGEGANCNTAVLFLTDGVTGDALTTIQSEISASQARLNNRAVIFTYSMGSGADTAKPQAIACANDGMWDSIASGVDPLTRMRGYFQYIAAGVNSSVARWTSVYEDAFGLGQMVTAALPVYDSLGGVRTLVGVVGTDVTMAELERFGDSATTVISRLFLRSSQCTNFTLSECERQLLRSQSPSGYQCPGQRTVAQCQQADDVVVVSPCAGVSGGLNSVLCDAMKDPVSRVVDGVPFTTTEATCCHDCLTPGASSPATANGQTGPGRVGEGAPNTPSSAPKATLASMLLVVIAVAASAL